MRTEGLISACGEPAGEASDPWCSDVFIRRNDEGGEVTLYVAVKYKEILARPVRAQPAGCGCADTQCEFSRFCDGYEIGVLSDCPESHKRPPAADWRELATAKLLDCPECPTDPWVVLAKVRLASDGVIQEIDNCSCRRIVISFGRFWLHCVSDLIRIDSVEGVLNPGGDDQTLTVKGDRLFSNSPSMVSLGAGVRVIDVEQPAGQAGKQLTITVNVDADAATGPRDLRLINPDCSTAITQITISGKTPAPRPSPRPEPRPQPRAAVETPSKKASKKREEEK